MAHDLHKNTMLYVGEVPWHGLGKKLEKAATYADCVEHAGFYDVEEREVFAAGVIGAITDKKALVRKDTGAYLSTVGKDYGVVQFSEMAEALMRPLGKEAVIHTAGLLGKDGVRGFITAELPNPITVKGDSSPIRKYLLATSSHSGYHKLTYKNVATRVVCQNTVGAALGEKGGFEVTIRHTSQASRRLEDASKAFARVAQSYERFGELANLMASTRISGEQVKEVLDAVLPRHDGRDNGRIDAKRQRIVELHETGLGMSGITGTAWGAYQAWTQFADHELTYRALPQRSASASRLESIWMGRSAELKQEALRAIADSTGMNLQAVLA